MSDSVKPDPDRKPDIRKIRVGLAGGTVHEFRLPVSEPVSSVVSLILDREKLDPSNNRVRIIVSGRLIQNHDAPLSEVLNDGAFIHAAISEPPPPTEEPDEADTADEDSVPLMVSAVDSHGEVRIIIPNLTPQGFERLSQAGFNEEEIRLIRRQLRIMGRDARMARTDQGNESDTTEREGDDDDDDSFDEEAGGRRTLGRTDPRLVLTSGAEGTNGDFLLGCIIGYMVGIMVLVFLLDINATRRWRVGIVAGVATNCAFGILRTSLNMPGDTQFAPP